MAKTCQKTGCDRGCYGEFCLMHKPRKPIAVRTPLARSSKPIKANKRPKQRGKAAMDWTRAKMQWFRENKAEYYTCYLCSKRLERNETTLDHIIPRSRAPHLRYVQTNLAPCCWPCNSEKGSQVY